MKSSQILRLAADRLPPDRRVGLCSMVHDIEPYSDKSIAIRRKIERDLGEFAYAPQWLGYVMVYGKRPKGKISNEQYRVASDWSSEQSTEKIQAWRRRWALNMVKEFESKGD